MCQDTHKNQIILYVSSKLTIVQLHFLIPLAECGLQIPSQVFIHIAGGYNQCKSFLPKQKIKC